MSSNWQSILRDSEVKAMGLYKVFWSTRKPHAMSEIFKGRHYNYATPRVEINGFNKAEDLCKES